MCNTVFSFLQAQDCPDGKPDKMMQERSVRQTMKPNGMCMMHRLSTCPAIFADLLDGGKHSAHTLKDDIQAFRM